jgi:hypothetical protein
VNTLTKRLKEKNIVLLLCLLCGTAAIIEILRKKYEKRATDRHQNFPFW